MEAIYDSHTISLDQEPKITPQKLRTRICSFSSEKGLYHPLMWAHYACGFKGIAIEVETSKGDEVHEVIYRENPTLISERATFHETVHAIITSKSRLWEYESEMRVTVETDPGGKVGTKEKVGTIRSIILGKPYNMISNAGEIYANSATLELYLKLANKLINVANENNIETKLAYLISTPTGPEVEVRNLVGYIGIDE